VSPLSVGLLGVLVVGLSAWPGEARAQPVGVPTAESANGDPRVAGWVVVGNRRIVVNNNTPEGIMFFASSFAFRPLARPERNVMRVEFQAGPSTNPVVPADLTLDVPLLFQVGRQSYLIRATREGQADATFWFTTYLWPGGLFPGTSPKPLPVAP
jgi:hypothetical protein